MKRTFVKLSRVLFLFLLLFVLTTEATEANPLSLVIPVAHSESKLPIVLAEISVVDSPFTAAYVSRLHEVLAHDLTWNGATVPLTCKKDELVFISDIAPNRVDWGRMGCPYFVQITIDDRKISCHLYIRSLQSSVECGVCELSGELHKDRGTIHRFADEIYKQIYDKPGIASSKILYTVLQPKGEGEEATSALYLCDYDGENSAKIAGVQGYCVTPTFIPGNGGVKASQILYVSYVTGQPKIYLYDFYEKKAKRLLLLAGNQLMPAASPTGQMIAFISDCTGNPDLFAMQYDSSSGLLKKPIQVYGSLHAVQGSPSFNKEGTKLAFVSNKDGSPRIYLIDLHQRNGSLKLISKLSRDNHSPAFSPDGQKIAFSGSVDGVRQIWLYDLHTGREEQLTEGPEHKENPSWARNGRVIVYNTHHLGYSELFLLDVTSRATNKITNGGGQKRFPAFEP